MRDIRSPTTQLTFSGHETFALRSTWLKKAFDLLIETPDLFFQENAFVRLGVGKNMAQSIRYWGRVCGIFERAPDTSGHIITDLGRKLLSDDGWDPFLTTPAASWLLHWHIAAFPEAAFTWYYTFNLLRGGEFTIDGLAQQIQGYLRVHTIREPSEVTLKRDIACMLDCYRRPENNHTPGEDTALCPLTQLGLIHEIPGQRGHYSLVSGEQESLPDALVAYAILSMARVLGRQTIPFSDLAYAPRSPGRIFRLEEDALLHRLYRLDKVTDGRAYYTDHAGIRQIAWRTIDDPDVADFLLEQAFRNE
ncbi:MAG: DUF4007 family protein [Roseiflexus sp.]